MIDNFARSQIYQRMKAGGAPSVISSLFGISVIEVETIFKEEVERRTPKKTEEIEQQHQATDAKAIEALRKDPLQSAFYDVCIAHSKMGEGLRECATLLATAPTDDQVREIIKQLRAFYKQLTKAELDEVDFITMILVRDFSFVRKQLTQ